MDLATNMDWLLCAVCMPCILIPILASVSKSFHYRVKVLFLILLYLVGTTLTSVYGILLARCDAHKMWLFFGKYSTFVSKYFLGISWRIEIDREEFEAARKRLGPFVIVANHQSELDVIAAAMVRRFEYGTFV